MVIVLQAGHATAIAGAQPEGDALWLAADDVEPAAGWALKAQGLCRDELCVPVAGDRDARAR